MNHTDLEAVVNVKDDVKVDVSVATASSILSNKKTQLVFALLFGLAVVAMVGLAPMDVLHSAAHDVRHVHAFPCH